MPTITQISQETNTQHEKRAYTESDDTIDTVLYHSISALCFWAKRQSVTVTIEGEWFPSFVNTI